MVRNSCELMPNTEIWLFVIVIFNMRTAKVLQQVMELSRCQEQETQLLSPVYHPAHVHNYNYKSVKISLH